ncbi:MAG: NAD-dependent deacylase [Candidatus Aminicenantes bacterium]|nr:NAD-dependent deacylase [Candidatus Aminicenantes bacterium]
MLAEEIKSVAELMDRDTPIAVLTGAGISAESGVPTFRGQGGLWKQFRAEDLATPEAFQRDPKLVWEWYDWRRGLMSKVEPNPGHATLALWERRFPEFSLITQNIDGLHARAGSRRVIELHGNIWKTRCVAEGRIIDNSDVPLKEIPPRCPSCGAVLRPHVVWFGESLDEADLGLAFSRSGRCRLMFVLGTSALVHPAASLPLAAARAGAQVVEINPDPTPLTHQADFSLRGKTGEILPLIDAQLARKFQE